MSEPEFKLPGIWVDPETIYPLIDCSWYECSGITRANLAKAKGLLAIYSAQRKIAVIGAAIGGALGGLFLGLVLGGLRRK